MNYKLTKQLKDARWPQQETTKVSRWMTESVMSTKEVFVPTLSELIEACGDKLGSIDHFPASKLWRAYADNYKDNQADGKTPEIAVAKLWLALNKK